MSPSQPLYGVLKVEFKALAASQSRWSSRGARCWESWLGIQFTFGRPLFLHTLQFLIVTSLQGHLQLGGIDPQLEWVVSGFSGLQYCQCWAAAFSSMASGTQLSPTSPYSLPPSGGLTVSMTYSARALVRWTWPPNISPSAVYSSSVQNCRMETIKVQASVHLPYTSPPDWCKKSGFIGTCLTAWTGSGELVEEIIWECGYWVIEPEFHIPPAPICFGNDLQGETFAVSPEVPEGVNLLNIALQVQSIHPSSDPVVWLVFDLPLLRVTWEFSQCELGGFIVLLVVLHLGCSLWCQCCSPVSRRITVLPVRSSGDDWWLQLGWQWAVICPRQVRLEGRVLGIRFGNSLLDPCVSPIYPDLNPVVLSLTFSPALLWVYFIPGAGLTTPFLFGLASGFTGIFLTSVQLPSPLHLPPCHFWTCHPGFFFLWRLLLVLQPVESGYPTGCCRLVALLCWNLSCRAVTTAALTDGGQVNFSRSSAAALAIPLVWDHIGSNHPCNQSSGDQMHWLTLRLPLCSSV